jgi:NADH dehydrogenase [ubiquinone] 1 alpha subcomplex assembly factor 5
MNPPSPVSAAPQVFDRALVRRRRERAAPGFPAHDFLAREATQRLIERLEDLNRPFPLAVDLGCGTGAALNGRFGIEALVHADSSEALARRAGRPAVVADEEWLPFAPASFDLIASVLALHRINDLPGSLVQIRRALRPDGLFLACLFGGESLKELRRAFADAEIAVEGGISPRVAPFLDLRDAAGLLRRAGFAMPVADIDTLTITYPDPFALMRDLRGMGETNALTERRKVPLRRATLHAAAEAYRDRFGLPDGRVPATVQLVWLTGWSPETAASAQDRR